MPNIIRLRIDVTKISKDRLYQGKNGAKYLNAACIPSSGQYDDTHFIVEDVSKEEREAGVKGVIIGNATELVREAQPAQRATEPEPEPELLDMDEVPF